MVTRARSVGATMTKRDRRRKLLGYLLEGGPDLVSRDVNRTLECERCGGPLVLDTVSMTGQTVEVCRQCQSSHPVQRFRPVAEE